MTNLDPAAAASRDELIACLNQLYIRADRPPLRDLQRQTELKRYRLARSAVSEMLRGMKFPKKAFLLTFVEACGVDIETDQRWEQAWDRLADQLQDRQDHADAAEIEELRQQVKDLQARLAAAEHQAVDAKGHGADTADDPNRVTRLLDRSLRAAYTIVDSGEQALTLAEVARAMSTVDLDQAAELANDAEHIARSITTSGGKVLALAGVAEMISTFDPRTAERLVDDAERLAGSVTDWRLKDQLLANIVKALAASDPGRAKQIATKSITDWATKALALAEAAKRASALHRQTAERLADNAASTAKSVTTREGLQARTLTDVAAVLAAFDPDMATRLMPDASSVTDPDVHAYVAEAAAKRAALADPGKAAELAKSTTDPVVRALMLAEVAKAHRDSRVAVDAAHAARSISRFRHARVVRNIAVGLAPLIPSQAEDLARLIVDDRCQAQVLAEVAKAVSSRDPVQAERLADNAERLARSITDRNTRARALFEVATALAS